MGKHWVKATRTVRVAADDGREITYHAGDWLEVRNQTLKVLLATGAIEHLQAAQLRDVYALDDVGVLLQDEDTRTATMILERGALGQICLKVGGLSLPYPRTLLWHTSAHIRHDLISVGFHRLARGWQIAAPLWRYQELARDIGTHIERARTEEVIHDLRVMVYDHRVLFVRRCPDTERWLEAYIEELHDSTDGRLALMRAIYRTKPVVCALPTTWVGK